LVLRYVLARGIADTPVGEDLHAVVAEVWRDGQQRVGGFLFVGRRQTEGVNLAKGEQNVVGARRGVEFARAQLADVLLVDPEKDSTVFMSASSPSARSQRAVPVWRS